MKKMLLLLPLLAAGCVAPGTELPPVGFSNEQVARADDTCGATNYASLIDAPRSRLDGLTLPEGTRIILPGDAVTTDYVETRLNFEIDGNTDIARIYCG